MSTCLLNSNVIVDVPPALSGLVALKKMSLANNRIVELPGVLEELWQLDGSLDEGVEPTVVVELHGNPLKGFNVLEDGVEDGKESMDIEEETSNKRQKVP